MRLFSQKEALPSTPPAWSLSAWLCASLCFHVLSLKEEMVVPDTGLHLCLNMAYSARVLEVLFGPVLAVNIMFTGLRDCCAVVCMYLPWSLHGNLYYHVEIKESNFIWKWFMYKAETNSRWSIRSCKDIFLYHDSLCLHNQALAAAWLVKGQVTPPATFLRPAQCWNITDGIINVKLRTQAWRHGD